MKKFFGLLIFLGAILTCYGQYSFVVLDSIGHAPIEYVSIINSNTQEGSITNKEGKATLFLLNENSVLLFTHIGYCEKKIQISQTKVDTVYLSPKQYTLPEVTVSALDLNKKFNEVLKNYNNLYVDYPLLRQCTYKETIKSQDTLTRLLIADIDWLSSSSAYNFKASLNKFCGIELKSIKAFKNSGVLSSTNANTGIAFGDFVSRLFLNFILENIVKNTNASLLSSVKVDNILKVAFTTDEFKISKSKEATAKFVGECYFNLRSGAIIFFNMDVLLSNYMAQEYNPDYKLSYKTATEKVSVKLSFLNGVDTTKYSLSHASMSVTGFVYLEGQALKSQTETVLYITKEEKMNAFSASTVDFTTPLYKLLPNNKKNTNTIILSKEEIDFINK